MKIEITEAQLRAIVNITDDVEGMIGCADDDVFTDGFNWDTETKKRVKLIDRFLAKNGYQRITNTK